ncbi:class I SAM-dependent rRNA methyltransferase [Halomonas elongata]|uniref:Class I SAM-dependent rRNA methyltransferase n=1 Tax=Halomonas elongata (strain ATCC 33173 / DSM 2581 / NBRC 15536 / NCIMB 2198 / 1H9) TaxID=768066 RepID=E1V934_HALED|nr:class I SAM-dependent rRNA methyltransferase [Halomonas elongata]RAW08383.1 class I SAM-dependent rRNA methyltransferase [Halomonas elongata]WBF17446.1 class I SAM-dependent rRNA methyltransferase [Halomonas elongata]WPU46285.1 class I SAM-dependent rRNA methyltransferase [Halomonas elongata DSM 2581]WVI71078.1 class I SAM-dependent rRNA methyltransferase [Halomonas elongata]CBV43706.1 probable S-adenosylmethionine-dependent methyltransferase [Halomonas elongata DSM 2581]
MTALRSLRLKKNADRRLKAGHLWLYSNEIDIAATPLKDFAPGEQAVVEAANGKAMGVAYVNAHSLICARLVSRDAGTVLDRSLLVHRLNQALSLRQRLFAKPFYRLVHGEGDLLPGLVIDRFDDVLVVQLNTAGMEAVREPLLDALDKVLSPRVVVLRHDTSGRRMEGLEGGVEVLGDEPPESVELEENGVRFIAPVMDGQKTGWFFDHRANRSWLNGLVAGKRVLDLFSYVGGWGVQAAAHGASEVLCVDASERALQGVAENAELNGLQERVAVGEGDAFEALAALKADDERFDVVILDPPAFIKKRKDMAAGERAYGRLNREAMRLLGRDGLLVSASCSMHLGMDRLTDVVRGAARHQDRHGQVIFQGHQGPDHPVHPAIPETSYLKALGVRVFRD